MRTECFAYDLPPSRIAQQPLEPRDAARMLISQGDAVRHALVRELPTLLEPGDLLLLNRTRVIPARLFGHKDSGGAVEVLLIHPEEDPLGVPGPAAAASGGECWQVMIRGRVQVGSAVILAGVTARVEAVHADGTRRLRFPDGIAVLELAERSGHVPLPPYILRADAIADRERYQTVFAEIPGSVAAPTAGLHLTTALLEAIDRRGVAIAQVELAIGPGTFKPVDSEQLEDFRIHAERCTCPLATVQAIARCRQRGGRVVAVGTTVLRVLETAARQPGGLAPYQGWTRLFLHPPERWQVVDGLLTNFHMPRSSLLMAVACLTGVDRLQALYREALASDYRFLSYGDCMLLLPPQPGSREAAV